MSTKFLTDIVIDHEKTFGELEFGFLGFVHYIKDENGRDTEEVERRTYDIQSKAQRGTIQVNIDGKVPEKKFDYDTPVELVNPRIRRFGSERGREVVIYLTADDLILRKQAPKTPSIPEKPSELKK